MLTRVSPAGIASVTVTAPLVGEVPALLAAIVYVAPFWPCEKFPLCDFEIVKSGGPLTVVTSDEVSLEVLVSPPPDTVALSVTLAAALDATLTVTVMGG
jgi:hypothetical protein